MSALQMKTHEVKVYGRDKSAYDLIMLFDTHAHTLLIDMMTTVHPQVSTPSRCSDLKCSVTTSGFVVQGRLKKKSVANWYCLIWKGDLVVQIAFYLCLRKCKLNQKKFKSRNPKRKNPKHLKFENS